jgi:hypothetical protein
MFDVIDTSRSKDPVVSLVSALRLAPLSAGAGARRRPLLIVALGALVGCVITFTGLLINLVLWPGKDAA